MTKKKTVVDNKKLLGLSEKEFLKVVNKILSGDIECIEHPFFKGCTIEKIEQIEEEMFMENKEGKCRLLMIDNKVINLKGSGTEGTDCLSKEHKPTEEGLFTLQSQGEIKQQKNTFELLGREVFWALSAKLKAKKKQAGHAFVVVRLEKENG